MIKLDIVLACQTNFNGGRKIESFGIPVGIYNIFYIVKFHIILLSTIC